MAQPLELSYHWQTPVALLKGGHATLCTWILAEAPHAELDKGSKRTVERLQSKGLL